MVCEAWSWPTCFNDFSWASFLCSDPWTVTPFLKLIHVFTIDSGRLTVVIIENHCSDTAVWFSLFHPLPPESSFGRTASLMLSELQHATVHSCHQSISAYRTDKRKTRRGCIKSNTLLPRIVLPTWRLGHQTPCPGVWKGTTGIWPENRKTGITVDPRKVRKEQELGTNARPVWTNTYFKTKAAVLNTKGIQWGLASGEKTIVLYCKSLCHDGDMMISECDCQHHNSGCGSRANPTDFQFRCTSCQNSLKVVWYRLKSQTWDCRPAVDSCPYFSIFKIEITTRLLQRRLIIKTLQSSGNKKGSLRLQSYIHFLGEETNSNGQQDSLVRGAGSIGTR